jgi:hypothetical protein
VVILCPSIDELRNPGIPLDLRNPLALPIVPFRQGIQDGEDFAIQREGDADSQCRLIPDLSL